MVDFLLARVARPHSSSSGSRIYPEMDAQQHLASHGQASCSLGKTELTRPYQGIRPHMTKRRSSGTVLQIKDAELLLHVYSMHILLNFGVGVVA